MNFPPSVKIGAHDYVLKFIPYWEGADEELANTHYESQTITINSGLSETQKFCTFLHEAMHVMNHDIDHALLDSLAEQIGQTLLDNGFIRDT